MSTATRIIKNTGFLYAKMGITVFISLYTTRLILSSLGASDFGIYNVVGGAISMMGFLNTTMANATQRFMSFSLGEGLIENSRKIFNISIILHFLIAIATALILLAVMWPLFNGVLNIPTERITAAKTVYLCLIFSTVITILNVPYDAIINSHENMLYYSIVGILEALLRLVVALLCVYSLKDKLVLYGVLMAVIPLITLIIMRVYCHRNYDECVFAPRKYWSSQTAKNILGFSGWNFLTAISYLFTTSGIGLVLNHFFGTLLNTAHGIANQINGYMTTVSLQLTKAVNPVIVKSAGAGSIDSMNRLTVASCKFTTFLVLLFSIPCIIEMPFVLGVWLKEVPEWAVLFCILQLVQTVICQTAANISTAIYAKGDIKGYAIFKSITNIAPLFIVYICFKLGGGPEWLYIPMIVVWGVGGNIVVVHFAKELCGFSVYDYLKKVLFPITGVSVIMIVMGYLPRFFLEEGYLRFLLCLIFTTTGFLASMFICGMSSSEREIIIKPIERFIRNRKSVR